MAQQGRDRSGDAAHGPLRSLARKGLWALVALLVYLVAATVIIALERQFMISAVVELERLHFQEEQQATLNIAVAHAIREVNDHYFTRDGSATAAEMAIDVDSIVSRLRTIRAAGPEIAEHIAELERLRADLTREAVTDVVAELRAAYHRLVTSLDGLTINVRERKRAVLKAYDEASNRAMIEWLVLVVLGLGVFGGVGSLFLVGLSKDLVRARTRAVDIVRGYRGAPLEVRRTDELGAMIAVINQMQSEIDERDAALELGRQQKFHTEKMAAVGSLAAAVAHEINNPLSAIVGIAENIAAGLVGSGGADGARAQAELILEQARRVMSITRQISEFSAPRPQVAEVADVNGLLRSTVAFVGFDKRFRGIAIDQSLDPDLPAVVIVSDHLIQVAMNLLINAADALTESRPPAPRIRLGTRVEQDWVVITVADNGPGIPSSILARVFDEHFTTKPAGRGSGLGLFVCRRLVRQQGGEISIDSAPGLGTTVRVTLPVNSGQNAVK